MTRKIATSKALFDARKVAKAVAEVKRNRNGRKNLDPKAFSRADAEKLLAITDDVMVCTALARHSNPHVQAKAARRAEVLVGRTTVVSEIAMTG